MAQAGRGEQFLSSAEQVEQISVCMVQRASGRYILTAKARTIVARDGFGSGAHQSHRAEFTAVVTIYLPTRGRRRRSSSKSVIVTDEIAVVFSISIHRPPSRTSRTRHVTVKRSGGTNVPLVLLQSQRNGRERLDNRSLSGEVPIPRGAWSGNISVDPIDDNCSRGPKPSWHAAARPLPAIHPRRLSAIVGDPARAIAYIRDNDFNQRPKVEIVHPSDGQVFPSIRT